MSRSGKRIPKRAERRPWEPEREPQAKQTGRKVFRPEYHTRKWRKYRLKFLQKNPLCVVCEKNKRVKAAEVVDHIDHEKFQFWDPKGHQPLCKSCHNRKSGKESGKSRSK